MTAKPIAIAVLFAIAEQRIGWQARNLRPSYSAQNGLFLVFPG